MHMTEHIFNALHTQTFDPSFVTSLSIFLLTIKLSYLHDLKIVLQCLLHLITYFIEITPNLHV